MYKVIHEFLDLQDDSHHYKVGDTYPRRGKRANAERVAELSGDTNKIGTPLIKEVQTAPKKRTVRKNNDTE